MKVQQIMYATVPRGEVKDDGSTFKRTEIELDDKASLNGGVLLKVLELSVDPYLRGRMRDESVKSYSPPLPAGQAMSSIGVALVLRSETDKFKEGDLVIGGLMPWQEVVVISGDGLALLRTVDKNPSTELSVYLSALGMPGRTAYTSFYDIGQPKKGESIFVTAASGAVGQLIVQLAKIEGMRVIACAGSDEKCEFVKSLGADRVFNYKTSSVEDELRSFSDGSGINVMYDNVGGPQLDAFMVNAANFARIVACGAISGYNGESYPLKNATQIVPRRLAIRGFIQGDYGQEWTERFRRDMGAHLAEGRIKTKEWVVEGLENGPKAFVDMMAGRNHGKTVIRVAKM